MALFVEQLYHKKLNVSEFFAES